MGGADHWAMTISTPCEHHSRVLCDICHAGILADYEIVASADGFVVATALAEDREAADLAAITLVEDGAEDASIIRLTDKTVVGHAHRTTENGVPAIRRTSWHRY